MQCFVVKCFAKLNINFKTKGECGVCFIIKLFLCGEKFRSESDNIGTYDKW